MTFEKMGQPFFSFFEQTVVEALVSLVARDVFRV